MLDVRLIILFVAFLFSACTDYVSQMEDDFEEWKTAQAKTGKNVSSSSVLKSSSSANASSSSAKSNGSVADNDCSVTDGVKVVYPAGGESFKIGDSIEVVFGTSVDDSYRIIFKNGTSDAGLDLRNESFDLNGPADGKTCYTVKVKLSSDRVVATSNGIIRVAPYNRTNKGANSKEFAVVDALKDESSSNSENVIPVDYTLGRNMNALLGRGINLGNSWDSDGSDDNGWGNPIRDSDFAVIKAAGFNSVRIPVRWQKGSDYSTHTVDPNRLVGVLEDIRLAIANDLAVVVNFHHYTELNCAGGGGDGCTYNSTEFEAEKTHFLGLWAQVASAMEEFADDRVVLEILNEPTIPNAELVDQLMNDAYKVIRAAAPGKTIMFEAYHAAKFTDITMLHLPQDGNIIFSGHYYEPYTYTFQGHGYDCIGDDAFISTADEDLKQYRAQALKLYPDVNGINQIPMNMGEFGVAGGDVGPCSGRNGQAPSANGKVAWTKKAVQAAINNGMSFHYWGYGYVNGFDAYDPSSEKWQPGFPQALIF